MELVSLILYGVVSLAMVVSGLGRKGKFCQYPFWAGTISLGFFFTQAVGGFIHVEQFPEGAYTAGMMFASLCMLFLWIGFSAACNWNPIRKSWLTEAFSVHRLYYIGTGFVVFGIFFQWKLWSLPEEMLARSQWSGATVKYNFFAGLFKLGFIVLWMLYLDQRKKINIRLLVFIVPCLILLADAAILRGRRAEMMNLCSYLVVGPWLVRRITLPRWVLVLTLVGGLAWVNGVEIYRSIMMDKEKPLSERLSEASKADYVSASTGSLRESSVEFKNYINRRHIFATHELRDYGAWHWNQLVRNYVPAQVFGSKFKKSLLVGSERYQNSNYLMQLELGYVAPTGSTSMGFLDSYCSFGWFGGLKFGLIGWIMGVLYRRAMQGSFLGQLLYVVLLSDAMHAVTHHTNLILVSSWVYFFLLVYPFLYAARIHLSRESEFMNHALIEGDNRSSE